MFRLPGDKSGENRPGGRGQYIEPPLQGKVDRPSSEVQAFLLLGGFGKPILQPPSTQSLLAILAAPGKIDITLDIRTRKRICNKND
jgi:hypothetical protein